VTFTGSFSLSYWPQRSPGPRDAPELDLASLVPKALIQRTVETLVMPYFVVIRERAAVWDWSVRMRQQAEWDAHATFMDALADRGYIVAGGPLGGEDDAARVMHVINVPAEVKETAIEAMMAEDPWTSMRLLRTVSIEPWSVLLGGFDCTECGSVLHAPKK
jgi:uncharacterized protein YciI